MRLPTLKILLFLAVAFAAEVFISNPVVAQKKERSIEWLLGEWEGEGTLFGNPARFNMKWEYILDSTFIQLTFQNQIISENQRIPAFKAIGVYQPGEDNKFNGRWFDSRGVQQSLDATFESPTLTTQWSNPSVEKGKTIYKIIGKRNIEVKDYVWKGNQWAEFGIATYTKK